MKGIAKYLLGAALIAATIGVSSCGDPFDSYNKFAPVDSNTARVKFVHAAPTTTDGLEIWVNGQRVSGVATTPPANPNNIKYGGIFPITEYASVPSGNTKIQWNIAGGTQPLITKDVALTAGKFYSQFVVEGPPYDVLTLSDELPAPSNDKVFYIRFINLIPNAKSAQFTYDGKPLDNPRTYAQTDGKFIQVPIADYSSGRMTKSIGVGLTGGATPVNLTGTISAVSPGAVYTVFARGMLTVDPKVPTKYAPTLVAYLNR